MGEPPWCLQTNCWLSSALLHQPLLLLTYTFKLIGREKFIGDKCRMRHTGKPPASWAMRWTPEEEDAQLARRNGQGGPAALLARP